jgi:quercetin dioxygenase-like cupin family protein
MTERVIPKVQYNYAGLVNAMYVANIGEGLPRHEHETAHLTFCLHGSIAVRKENFNGVLKQGDMPLNLRENEWHEIEALEDGTVFINQFAQ